MKIVTQNKNLYSNLWRGKIYKDHTYWETWDKFQLLIPQKDPKLLDIGCGMRPRIPMDGSYFIDLSPSALDTIRSHGGICYCGNATSLPYKNEFFDLVNATELLEHIEDDNRVFQEINRVLKNTGYFSFSVPLHMKYWSEHDNVVKHVRRYSIEDLSEKIKRNGFEIFAFHMNNTTTMGLYRNIGAYMLKVLPHIAIAFEEHIALPIGHMIRKRKKIIWHTENFSSLLQNTGGVIVICHKKV